MSWSRGIPFLLAIGPVQDQQEKLRGELSCKEADLKQLQQSWEQQLEAAEDRHQSMFAASEEALQGLQGHHDHALTSLEADHQRALSDLEKAHADSQVKTIIGVSLETFRKKPVCKVMPVSALAIPQ